MIHRYVSRGLCRGASTLPIMLIAALTAAAQSTTPPEPLQGIGIDQKLNAQVPLDLAFHDETGRTVRLGEYFDGRRPVVLTLVYLKCPMLCTLVLNDTLRALRTLPLDLGRDFDVLTVSFNPREGPDLAGAKRRGYLEAYRRPGAESSWHFLTGDEATIQRLTDCVGFRYRYDAKTDQFFHPAGIIVLTPQGRVSRYFFGISYQPKDLRLALVEASNRQIGTLTDSVLLFCYHYDPSTGKYGLAVMNALRVGAAITLLALGLTVFRLIRVGRRRQRAALDAGGSETPATGHLGESRRL